MVILFFVIIALMRVIQRTSAKKASTLVNDRGSFFQYGGYYQGLSALFALIFLCFTSFQGFDGATIVCAAITAILFALDLYSNIEALKGCTLMICQMMATGGLLVPCIAGIFLFDEPMGLWQWFGLALFLISVYFLANDSKEENKKFTFKTFVMLLVVFFSNGLVMLVQKYFALYSPTGNVGLYSALTFALNALLLYGCRVLLLLKKSKQEGMEGKSAYPWKRMDKSLFLYGALLALGVFTVNLLVTTMAKTVPSAVLFTVTSALSIAVTCLVGAVGFKEKITAKKIVGILLGFVSIILVSVF